MTKAKTKTHSPAATQTAGTKPEGRTNVRSVSQTGLTVMGPVVTTATKQPRQTKAALLRAMLEAPGGASLTQIMTETGWQAHTVRAALTGLRKAGLHLTRCHEGDDTIYAIEAAAKVAAGTTVDGNDDCRESVEVEDATLTSDADGSSPTSTNHGEAVLEARV